MLSDLASAKATHRRSILQAMRAGGFLDAVRSAGPSLERVLHYLQAFDDQAPHPDPLRHPDYPAFPGIRGQRFWDPSEVSGVAVLEAAWTQVRDDWQSLAEADTLRYVPPPMRNTWRVHMLHYMGVDLEPMTGRCARTHALLRQVPGLCLDYPWADALLSIHVAKSRLGAHCSVDTLRVRCHLGLQVPPDCGMRVGGQEAGWTEGGALLFDDSYLHEVWNDGDRTRAIFIVDFWNPDLTEAERAALVAGFRHSSVRSLFMRHRAAMAQPYPHALMSFVEQRMAEQDLEPAVRDYWMGQSGA
ncbi:MAG TPA: aspartyl/asparaginyl beta-hydroxylase domain-containing protein [Ramlibacter sp.]|nr:aspartyl/asparaginyl beta-hydroxylase domain-containing protein [Ramlibacter sp.]